VGFGGIDALSAAPAPKTFGVKGSLLSEYLSFIYLDNKLLIKQDLFNFKNFPKVPPSGGGGGYYA
jgi:hypothetical protein